MESIDSSWGLNNADLLQQNSNCSILLQIATLGWLQGSDESKKLMENLTQLRVGYELWQRVSGQRELDALRNQTILSICKYVKDHPKATKDVLAKEVARQIQHFAEEVEKL
ncbi:uncharacterized protein LOC135466951 [Liolophura sinensis]|uniref:uncharacterized protein LOC135466951 n=1 Tax=Liolophura sinensis TaxID=3198878 RepID=UPI0031597987